jgi:pullulanase
MISKGTVFFQAGEEMLRTKPKADGTFDENSYKSSDAINNINWSALSTDSDEYKMMTFYKSLIRLRKTYGIFTTLSSAVSATDLKDGRYAVTIDNHMGGKAMIIINPTGEAMTYTASGSWNMLSDGETVNVDSPVAVSGDISISAYSAIVLINDKAMI